MSDEPYLSFDEIKGITDKVQPAAQLRHLRRMGIRAYRRENGKGSVCVLRAWLAPAPTDSAESKAPRLQSDRNPKHEPTAQARP